MHNRIHILGAAGTGKSTLGKSISDMLQVPFLDTDEYYWENTDPPFKKKRLSSKRIEMILDDISGYDSWVLAGSLCSWGDPLLHFFTLAVFLSLEPDTRIRRLEHREQFLYGDRITEGGDMFYEHLAFLEWAKTYESENTPKRSRKIDEIWIKKLPCHALRLDSSQSVDVLITKVTQHLNQE